MKPKTLFVGGQRRVPHACIYDEITGNNESEWTSEKDEQRYGESMYGSSASPSFCIVFRIQKW